MSLHGSCLQQAEMVPLLLRVEEGQLPQDQASAVWQQMKHPGLGGEATSCSAHCCVHIRTRYGGGMTGSWARALCTGPACNISLLHMIAQVFRWVTGMREVKMVQRLILEADKRCSATKRGSDLAKCDHLVMELI